MYYTPKLKKKVKSKNGQTSLVFFFLIVQF